MEVDGVFMAIGHDPNVKFLDGQVNTDEGGYIIPIDQVKTSVEGVFVAGDVSDWKYQQAVVAAGYGVMAQMEAEEWLNKKEFEEKNS